MSQSLMVVLISRRSFLVTSRGTSSKLLLEIGDEVSDFFGVITLV